MKIKDLVEYLSKLDQDKEILIADYYYDAREGFINWDIEELEKSLVLVEDSNLYFMEAYKNNPYIFDPNDNLKIKYKEAK